MDFKELSHVVSKHAPLLGSLISELNPIAGTIIMMISKLFNSTSDTLDIIKNINSDPEAKIKLKKMELENWEFLFKNKIEDKKDARNREEKIIQLTGRRDWILDILAMIIVPGFIILCLLMAFFKIENDHFMSILLGQISSGFMLCLSYYFGSSNGK